MTSRSLGRVEYSNLNDRSKRTVDETIPEGTLRKPERSALADEFRSNRSDGKGTHRA